MKLEQFVESHLAWLRSMQYADSTLKNRRTSLQQLVEWASERAVTRPEELDLDHVEAYRTHLTSRRKANGDHLAIGSQVQRLLAVKMFCRWLYDRGHIIHDLATPLRFPRRPQSLPRGILNQAEVERVLRVPDLNTATGHRDRTMLEVLYATGIRRSELAALTRDDVDRVRQVVFILEGKGAKDRVVPISERALWWISAYVSEARPKLLRGHDTGHLFLTAWGRPMPPKRLSVLVAGHIAASGVRKRGSCHLFRHTTATLMLEGGADIRYIQELLGHSQLASTAVYTRVSIKGLKEVYRRTHPAYRKL